MLRALEETENALVSYREQQQRLVSSPIRRARAAAPRRSRASAIVKDWPTFSRCSTPSAPSCRPQEAVAQAEAGVFTGVVGIYKSLGGIPR